MKKSLGCFYHQQEDDYGEGEDDAEVQQECLHKFSTRDYIMEPSIFNTLKRCVRKGTGMGRRLGATQRSRGQCAEVRVMWS